MARTWATGRAGQEKRGGDRPRDTLRRGREERTDGRVLERSEKKLNGPKSCTLQIRAEYSAAIPAATGTLPLRHIPVPTANAFTFLPTQTLQLIPVTTPMHAHTKNNYGKSPIGQVISHSGLVRFRKTNPG